MDIGELEKMALRVLDLQTSATPGPYFDDCGNGEIESRNPDHWRIAVCERCDFSDRLADYKRKNSAGEPRDTSWDMMFIEACLNAAPDMARAILELTRLARERQ